jgi:hypothetical protein
LQFAKLIRADFATAPETVEVEAIAQQLLAALGEESAYALLVGANQPGASSHRVQDAILPVAATLGFSPERCGMFANSIPGLRPDFHRKVGSSGIILEVERGKTTTNNMDILDFWKCHLCNEANYLFLFVPLELRHNSTMSPKREFSAVKRRLAPFFEPGNYTNVRGLFLFGY